MRIEPMELIRRCRFFEGTGPSTFDQARDINERDDATADEEDELDGIRPDHRFDAADVSVDEGENDKEQDGGQDIHIQHELDGNASHINPHAGCQRAGDHEEKTGRALGSGAERVSHQLIGRVDLPTEVTRHHDRRQH